MRAAIAIAMALVAACGAGDQPAPTSGPIESIVHVSPTAVQLYAVRHRLDLAALPLDGAPVPALVGPIELDAAVTIPLDLLRPDATSAYGRVAVRCTGACRVGGDAAMPAVDLTGLAVEVAIRRGTARLTRWALASADVEATLGLTVRLARDPAASRLDGCLVIRPTAAAPPPLRAAVDALAPADGGGWHRLRLGGTVGAPDLTAAPCEPAGGDG